MIDGEPKKITGLYLKYANNQKIDKEALVLDTKIVQNRHPETPISKTNIKTDDYYDPKLVPKSTTRFDINGATITNVRLINELDRDVNILNSGDTYRIQFDVKIHEILEDVRFGVSIRNMHGIYYAGAAYELLKHSNVRYLNPGDYRISFAFECRIVEGVFVIDVAILRDFRTKRINAHRIHDVLLFKVNRIDKDSIELSHISLFKDYNLECIS